MDYIVLDLEWNQGNAGSETDNGKLVFEIIEIGAIKLNDSYVMISEFNELIRPRVYQKMHPITGRLLHLQMEELERGRLFKDVAEHFLNWCGEKYRFCTWGVLDLAQLQHNMKFYGMEPLAQGPIPFLDVQKLFALAYEENAKVRRSLEYAIDFLKVEKDIPFHRAFSDAYYTAKVFAKLAQERPDVLVNLSYDVTNPPKRREDEVKIQFEHYFKYISRQFADKTEALEDREVVSSKCYLCHRNLKKQVKWFTPNGKNYYCAAYCEKHGYLKGKIRVRRTEEDMVYIVKTTKFISEQEAEQIAERYEHIKELRKQHKKKRH
ncbi:MAG: exonuclease domain-containing protein [Bacteroidales bacterium]|nr:exonuclease domain-containing protein [Lachnoclostridium sp.]MCM1384553.1 exonuclease domain-containing protein [Lachnoclostridium sp.]MCM1465165.1 exonuclease domain-containing protein [Bacteroidales bacterium]